MPPWLIRELRSDHAGETGAVAIYQGILAASRDPAVVNFAKHHLGTERDHLALMDRLLPRTRRSKLLFLWRAAGFLTGYLPAIFGSNSVFRTVEAVEKFVDVHYSAQIDRLRLESTHWEIRQKLESCRDDERHHLELIKAMLVLTWRRRSSRGQQEVDLETSRAPRRSPGALWRPSRSSCLID